MSMLVWILLLGFLTPVPTWQSSSNLKMGNTLRSNHESRMALLCLIPLTLSSHN